MALDDGFRGRADKIDGHGRAVLATGEGSCSSCACGASCCRWWRAGEGEVAIWGVWRSRGGWGTNWAWDEKGRGRTAVTRNRQRPSSMDMPAVAMPLAMPMSSSGCFSQPKVLQEKLLTSLGSKLQILQVFRTRFSQNPNSAYTKISTNTSG